MSNIAVFLDRDGTLIEEKNYLSDPDGVELLPNSAEGLQKMMLLGLKLVVVSNQSGIGRGYFTYKEADAVNARMAELFAMHGVEFDQILYCPHAPEENCRCRKPKIALLEKAALELDIALNRSFVIGDKPCDLSLALNCKATPIAVETGYPFESLPEGAYKVPDLLHAANLIEQLLEG